MLIRILYRLAAVFFALGAHPASRPTFARHGKSQYKDGLPTQGIEEPHARVVTTVRDIACIEQAAAGPIRKAHNPSAPSKAIPAQICCNA
jgi:hypothetical protein